MKICSKCKNLKEDKEFYKDKRSKDGLYSWCKKCHLEINKNNSYKYFKKYKYKIKYTEKMAKYFKEYRKNPINRKKGLCRSKTGKLVKWGKIKKLPCKICGDKEVQIHHPDYNNPFKVEFLCSKHHRELHNLLKLFN